MAGEGVLHFECLGHELLQGHVTFTPDRFKETYGDVQLVQGLTQVRVSPDLFTDLIGYSKGQRFLGIKANSSQNHIEFSSYLGFFFK